MAIRPRPFRSAALGALSVFLVSSGPAGADRGIPLGPERASPIVVGVLAGALATGAGAAAGVIAMRLVRKPPRAP